MMTIIPARFGSLIEATYPAKTYTNINHKSVNQVLDKFKRTRNSLRRQFGDTIQFIGTSPTHLYLSTGQGPQKPEVRLLKKLTTLGFTAVKKRGIPSISGKLEALIYRPKAPQTALLVHSSPQEGYIFVPNSAKIFVHQQSLNPRTDFALEGNPFKRLEQQTPTKFDPGKTPQRDRGVRRANSPRPKPRRTCRESLIPERAWAYLTFTLQ